MRCTTILPPRSAADTGFLARSDALDAALAAALVAEREAYRDGRAAGYEQGRAEGYAAAVAEIKGVQQELVSALGDLADMLAARYHLCCIPCRRRGHRHGCADCEDRTSATWAAPMPGEYLGGPAPLARRRAS